MREPGDPPSGSVPAPGRRPSSALGSRFGLRERLFLVSIGLLTLAGILSWVWLESVPAVGLLAGILVAAFLSWLAAHLATSQLRRVVASLQQATSGNHAGHVEEQGDVELRGVTASFNRVVDELDATIRDLGEERDRLAAVLRGMGEAVLVLDAEDRVRLTNPAARALARDPAGDGRAALDELLEVPAFRELLESTRESPGSEEFDLPGEPVRRLVATVTPLQASEGRIVVLHEVTRLRRLETIRRDFIANLSHELRTPLAVLRMNAETLLDGAMEDPVQGPEFLKAVVESTRRLSALVDDLLDITRLESGQRTLKPEPVELAGEAAAALAAIEPVAAARGIRLASGVVADQVAWVDPGALRRILGNLLENAVKYNRAGGEVRLEASRREGAVRLSVLDEGPGIPAAHRERIFERFYRIDPGRSRAVGGTGLGLAIVKHLVVSQGGAVGVASREPAGSVFWVELPDGPRVPAQAPAPAQAQPISTLSAFENPQPTSTRPESTSQLSAEP